MPAEVTPAQPWQAAFVAMTVALGNSVDDACAALDASDVAVARTVIAGLRHPEREVRARTLAAELAPAVTDVATARLV